VIGHAGSTCGACGMGWRWEWEWDGTWDGMEVGWRRWGWEEVGMGGAHMTTRATGQVETCSPTNSLELTTQSADSTTGATPYLERRDLEVPPVSWDHELRRPDHCVTMRPSVKEKASARCSAKWSCHSATLRLVTRVVSGEGGRWTVGGREGGSVPATRRRSGW
jgi:hypothetical protein